jgi:hypothetical protein
MPPSGSLGEENGPASLALHQRLLSFRDFPQEAELMLAQDIVTDYLSGSLTAKLSYVLPSGHDFRVTVQHLTRALPIAALTQDSPRDEVIGLPSNAVEVRVHRGEPETSQVVVIADEGKMANIVATQLFPGSGAQSVMSVQRMSAVARALVL